LLSGCGIARKLYLAHSRNLLVQVETAEVNTIRTRIEKVHERLYFKQSHLSLIWRRRVFVNEGRRKSKLRAKVCLKYSTTFTSPGNILCRLIYARIALEGTAPVLPLYARLAVFQACTCMRTLHMVLAPSKMCKRWRFSHGLQVMHILPPQSSWQPPLSQYLIAQAT